MSEEDEKEDARYERPKYYGCSCEKREQRINVKR